MKEMSMRFSKGFTLIEILLVFAMIGLLSAFLVPQFNSFNQRQTLRAATVRLTDKIDEVRSLASSGVQGVPGEFVETYRFALNDNGGSGSSYREYVIQRHLASQSAGTYTDLETKDMVCPICVNEQSSGTAAEFRVPSGSRVSPADTTFQVCYPNYGFYDVTIDGIGNVSRSDLNTGSCSCNVDNC